VPVSTITGWLRSGPPRRPGSASCDACGASVHAFDDLPDAYVYLLGLYLGDGYIASHPRGVYRLRIKLDARYPGIVDACAAAMAEIVPQNRVGRVIQEGSWVEAAAYSRQWPCLFPQAGPGKKHLRRIILAPWQERLVARNPMHLLRGLIHSDGCRFENTGRNWSNPRYSFSNVSDDIRRIFCGACDLLDLHWTVAPPKTVYVSRKADVARLDGFIGPKS